MQVTWFLLFCRVHLPWLFPDFPGQNESFSLTNVFMRNTNVSFQSLAITLETRAWDHMGSHTITCHPIQTNSFLPCIWKEGQTSAYCCCNLPSGETGTNLYCLVNRCTCAWTIAQGCYLAVPQHEVKPATSGLQVRHVTVTLPSHT